VIKVLWYSDFLVPTGFGNVAEEIIKRLLRTGKYDFTILGINHTGDHDHTKPSSPYYENFRQVSIHPASRDGDLFGQDRLFELLDKGDYDVLFVLQDPFNVMFGDRLNAVQRRKGFRYVFYFPVDGDVDPRWIQEGVLLADKPVTYTRFGQGKIQEACPNITVESIYHGTDVKTFKPLSEQERNLFRRVFLGFDPNDFVITNVNRNQPRKDLPNTIMAWLWVKQREPHAKLYLHTDVNGQAGRNLLPFIQRYVPDRWRDDISYCSEWGLPRDYVRKVYGASDVVVSSSLGEGWGLSVSEAMACRVPVAMPRHTSLVELIGEEEQRGLLADCHGGVVLPGESTYRSAVSVESLGEKILEVKKDPEAAARRTRVAVRWVRAHCNWDKITERWDEILTDEAQLAAYYKKSQKGSGSS
jgi:D-inositol-3-phosphate glycosyltransferase